MAHALRLEDYIPPDPLPLGERDAAIPATTGPRGRERYTAIVRRTEQSVKELRESLEQAVDAAAKEVSRGELDVDAAIERLRGMEDDIQGRWLMAVEVAEFGRELALRIPDSDARTEAVSLFERMIEAVGTALEAVRDCRWQLLSLRAEAENQKGAIFTDADDLVQHLHRS